MGHTGRRGDAAEDRYLQVADRGQGRDLHQVANHLGDTGRPFHGAVRSPGGALPLYFWRRSMDNGPPTRCTEVYG